MKIFLSLIFVAFLSLLCPAQKPSEKAEIAARRKILKKQIFVDDFDRQAQNIPFAAVRVYVRTKLAEWLWKNGRDETDRAESLAVRAVEELYEKKDEISESASLKGNLFTLLEVNAKETMRKLRAKYRIEGREDLSNAFSLMNKEGGDKIVAEKIKRNLTGKSDLNLISIYLNMLRQRNSPEFLALLFEIVNLQESGKINYSSQSLFSIASSFREPVIPNDLRIRFYKIVLNKAKNALQSSDQAEIQFADSLLFLIYKDIQTNAVELFGEASAMKIILSSKTSQRMRDIQERERRIEESADKLSALISEADNASDQNAKFQLLIRAHHQAVKETKFKLAVDLLERTIEDSSDKNSPDKQFPSVHDQQLNQIAEAALGKDDIDSARYALKPIFSDLKKADILRLTASYYFRKKDSASALSAYDEALKLVVKADDADDQKVQTLLRLTNTAAVEPRRFSEIISLTAKTIDRMPTLAPEDKPGTENFKNYVSNMMRINNNLYAITYVLAKKYKPEAAMLAERINRREIKIAAELALAIDNFEIIEKTPKTR